LKVQHTKRLHWNKYLYKVTLYVPRVAWLRYNKNLLSTLCNCETLLEWRQKNPLKPVVWLTNDRQDDMERDLWENRFTLYKIAHFRNNCDEHHVRLDDNKITYFTSNTEDYEQFCRLFKDFVIELQFPEEGKEHLLEEHVEYVEKFPHGKYKYKTYFKPYWNSPREGFGEWIRQYPDIKITKQVIKTIERGYMPNGKFFYSTNTDMMLLLQLYLGTQLGKTVTYKLESETNG